MTPSAAPSNPTTGTGLTPSHRVGLAGLVTAWIVLPFTTTFAPHFVPALGAVAALLVAMPILVDALRHGASRRPFGLEDVGLALFFCGATIAIVGPQAVVDRWTCVVRTTQLGAFATLYLGLVGHLRRDVGGAFARAAMTIGAVAAIVHVAHAIVDFAVGDHDRLTSRAFNPNFFASFVLAWTLVFVPTWLGRKGGTRKVVIAALVLAPLLVATGSKAGVMFFVGLVLLLLVGKTRLGFVRTGLLVVAVAAAVFTVPNPLRTRVLAGETNQVYPRRFYYRVALENIADHPFGIGPGMNKFHFAKRAFDESEPSYLHRRREVGLVHNVFLGAALETGWIGACGVVLFVVGFLRRGLRRLRDAHPLAIGALAGATLLWLHAQVDGLSQSTVMMSSLFAMAALVRVDAERRERATEGFRVPRLAFGLALVVVLALPAPGIASALASRHLQAGDDALTAADPRLAFVEFSEASSITPLDTVPRKRALEALLYVFDLTLDPMIVQNLGALAREAAALNPLDPEPWLLSAQAIVTLHLKLKVPAEHKLMDDAQWRMGQALEIDPLDVETRLGRARLLGFLGRSDEAIAEARQAIAYEPNYVDAHVFLSDQLERADEFDAAAASLEDAIRAFGACVEIARDSRYGPVPFFEDQVKSFDPVAAQTDVRRLKNHVRR